MDDQQDSTVSVPMEVNKPEPPFQLVRGKSRQWLRKLVCPEQTCLSVKNDQTVVGDDGIRDSTCSPRPQCVFAREDRALIAMPRAKDGKIVLQFPAMCVLRAGLEKISNLFPAIQNVFILNTRSTLGHLLGSGSSFACPNMSH